MTQTITQASKRAVSYGALFALLFLGYLILRYSTWQGDKQLHTLIELFATSMALVVGVLALVRYYTKKNNTILFIGTGFIGTALLDGYHAVVTSTFFDFFFPSPPPSLIPWSWNASRCFLAILMLLSFWAWRREKVMGERGKINEKTIYAIVGLLTLASFIFFAVIPLPRAYYPEFFFGRPEEFIAAFFFLFALLAYLKKGVWKRDAFEHWLVVSLIIGLMSQALFMSFSFGLFDMMFDVAHLLKALSYICIFIGLLNTMSEIFTEAETGRQKMEYAYLAVARAEYKLSEKVRMMEKQNRNL